MQIFCILSLESPHSSNIAQNMSSQYWVDERQDVLHKIVLTPGAPADPVYFQHDLSTLHLISSPAIMQHCPQFPASRVFNHQSPGARCQVFANWESRLAATVLQSSPDSWHVSQIQYWPTLSKCWYFQSEILIQCWHSEDNRITEYLLTDRKFFRFYTKFIKMSHCQFQELFANDSDILLKSLVRRRPRSQGYVRDGFREVLVIVRVRLNVNIRLHWITSNKQHMIHTACPILGK